MTPTIDYINDLCTRAHTNAKDKGWYDEGERSWAELMALVHTELAEMTEAYRKGNPSDEHCPEFDSVSIELADAVIRLADAYGWAGEVTVSPDPWCIGAGTHLGPVGAIAWMHGAIQYVRCGNDVHTFLVLFRYADDRNIDLPAAIEAKMKFNTTRPYRHGGKAY